MSDDEVLDDADIVLSSSEDHDDGADALSPNQSKKRGRTADAGRGPRVLWVFFTDDPDPHKLKSAECKHYHTRINHHKKSERANTHLNKCAEFRQLMNGIDVDGRPSWYVPNKKRITKRNSAEGTGAKSSIHNYLLPSVMSKQKDKFQYHITGAL